MVGDIGPAVTRKARPTLVVSKSTPFRSQPLPTDYPLGISEIGDGLYLAGAADLRTSEFTKYCFTHILNVADDATIDRFSPDIIYMNVPLADNADGREPALVNAIARAVMWIHKALQSATSGRPHRVLVYCQKGVNRSASVMIAYLIAFGGSRILPTKLSMRNAMLAVQHHRQQIGPTFGYLAALRGFADTLSMLVSPGLSPSLPVPRLPWDADEKISSCHGAGAKGSSADDGHLSCSCTDDASVASTAALRSMTGGALSFHTSVSRGTSGRVCSCASISGSASAAASQASTSVPALRHIPLALSPAGSRCGRHDRSTTSLGLSTRSRRPIPSDVDIREHEETPTAMVSWPAADSREPSVEPAPRAPTAAAVDRDTSHAIGEMTALYPWIVDIARHFTSESPTARDGPCHQCHPHDGSGPTSPPPSRAISPTTPTTRPTSHLRRRESSSTPRAVSPSAKRAPRRTEDPLLTPVVSAPPGRLLSSSLCCGIPPSRRRRDVPLTDIGLREEASVLSPHVEAAAHAAAPVDRKPPWAMPTFESLHSRGAMPPMPPSCGPLGYGPPGDAGCIDLPDDLLDDLLPL